MLSEALTFLEKAEESLSGAASELINGQFNNCASRCYFACFQAAVHALTREGIRPRGERWEHAFVQAQFAGELVNRRKRYPAELRDTLIRNQILRRQADYEQDRVTEVQAARALGRAREFLEAIRPRR